MSRLACAFFFMWTAAPVSAQSTESAKSGWFQEPSSLLYYDASGALAGEIGLGRWERPAGEGIDVREFQGGVNASRRFAWVLELSTRWDAPRIQILGSRRLLRLLGSGGKELWRNPAADRPGRGEPLVFSENGEILIDCSRDEKGWTVAIKNYLGAVLFEAGPFPILDRIDLTPNGRYALARWTDPDKNAVHTLIDARAKTRRDIPSADFYRGAARLEDDGKVFSGAKLIADLGAEESPRP